MAITLHIFKDGVSEQPIRLSEGCYKVGRVSECDIVLNHPSVSKAHATLQVTPAGTVIRDAGSANGIFEKGKKFSERTFPSGFEIEIGPCLLKGLPDARGGEGVPHSETARPGGFLNILSKLDFRLLLFASFALMLVIAFFGIRLPADRQIASMAQQEATNRGILLARYLCEINRTAVETQELDTLRVDPVNMEEGVVYAYVVNMDGQVLSPLEDRGNFITWPGFSDAVKKGALEIAAGDKNEQIIFCPLKVLDKIKAAAIVGYKTGAGASSTGSEGAYALLLILSAIAALMASLIVKIFVKPLRDLEEEIRVAVKNNYPSLNFKGAYREIDELARAFDRLFTKAPVESLRSAQATFVPPPPLSPSENARTDSVRELMQAAVPGCILDLHESHVVGYNDAFKKVFTRVTSGQGQHVIEVFEQPKILKAVSDLIETSELMRTEVADMAPPMIIEKLPVHEDAGKIILIFKDSSHE